MNATVQVMSSIILFLPLVFSVSCLVAAHSDQISLPGRSLLQDSEKVVASVRVANLTSIMNVAGDSLMPEQELKGRINVTSSDVPVLYGAYYLGSDEVAQINHSIASELVCCLCLLLLRASELLCTFY
jgi:hypothetical protein